jgi:hypothetical protein
VPIAEVSAGVIMIAIVLVALPIGAIVFATGAGGALKEIGKGDFAIEQEPPPRPGGAAAQVSGAVREEEIRQMVQARSDRAVARGEKARDVESEVQELLASQRPSGLRGDSALRDEVRGLVIARNERRVRQGKEPLDVEAEIDRQLDELENLGQ